ncbi:amidohydrolase family protein [candidate division KSB1 bacterium]|nr:amidohydrolase family protein [candidate division KSB1 bacterium]
MAVGSNLMIDKYRTNETNVINAQGKLVIPGFIDAHCHFAAGGKALRTLSFRGIDSIYRVQQMIAAKVKELPPGAVIYGRNYDHTLFPDGEFPNRKHLDEVAPNNPVIIRRVDGHSCWVNSFVLNRAGIHRRTKDPFGGEIVKDKRTGIPTGILKESAMNLIDLEIYDTPNAKTTTKDIELAIEHAAELGITGVHTSAGLDELEIYKKLEAEGKLSLRVYAWQYLENLDTLIALGWRQGTGTEFLKVGFLKSYIDGTLGSGTALFFEPYNDDNSTSGLAQYPEAEFRNLIARAHERGYQTGTHAIGSKGVNWVLNAIESAQQLSGKKGLRHRIEHAQVVQEQDFARFAELDVIASMQPTHCTTDLRFCEQRIGKERSAGAYAWRTMQDNNVWLAFGTDWPVEPLDPMRGIYSAVTRKNIEGNFPIGGWFPEQRLTVHEALKYYTLGSAYASFEEEIKGSLAVGRLADIVILDKDIFTIDPGEILHTDVLTTIVDGKIVYQRKY